MTDMIEVVARAMYAHDKAQADRLLRAMENATDSKAWVSSFQPWERQDLVYKDLAKAALTALRDNVSEGMVEVGAAMCDDVTDDEDRQRARGVYWAMLDHALTERE